MLKSVYQSDLEERLTGLKARIQVIEEGLDRDSPVDRVHAVGQLAILKQRLHDLTEKFESVRTEGDGLYAKVTSELDADIGSIGNALERLFSGVR